MPWKTYTENGRYCVYRVTEGGEQIKKLKCYPNKADASAYQRALYAHENKELEEALIEYMVETELIAADDSLEDKSIEFKKLAARYYIDEVGEDVETKAVWSTAYKNDLPDSAFLYVEPGEKDSEGKTVPRSKRHFPYKDASGKVDRAHITNAIARIPQANIPAAKKKALQERARRILANLKKEVGEKEDETLTMKIKSVLADILGMEQKKKVGNFVVWKEKDGTMPFIARYSNNIRDEDNPPEIISSKSHERFVKLVDEGTYPLPTLEVWHVPALRFGKATHVAYDNSGFALAAGVIDDNEVAQKTAYWLSEQEDVAMSHGMLTSSIKRDADDPTVIVEHQTVEISVLPKWAAANKMTDFVILDDRTKEESMAIPAEKRASLQEEWGASPELLDSLEQLNLQDAETAEDEGKESKEVDTQAETGEAETEEAQAETVEATAAGETESTEEVSEEVSEQETTEAEAKEAEEDEAETQSDPLEEPPTRREVAEFLADTIQPYLDRIAQVEGGVKQIGESVNVLAEAVKELAQTDEEKIQKAVLDTPAASMSALLAERFSAIGKEKNAVDGRSSLAKSKPEESPPNEGSTGIPLLNKLISGEKVGGDYFTSQNE